LEHLPDIHISVFLFAVGTSTMGTTTRGILFWLYHWHNFFLIFYCMFQMVLFC